MAEEEAGAVDETAEDDAAVEQQDGQQQDQDGGGKPSYEELTRHSRRHERTAKERGKRIEELEAMLKEREDADKTEAERELEQAREEARQSALAEVQAERQQERLETAVTKLAAKSFNDVEDALKFLDVDPADIFDEDGKVQTTVLQEALDELLERKPYLAAKADDGNWSRFKGPSGAGQGQGRGKDLADLSVEEHLKRQQARNAS